MFYFSFPEFLFNSSFLENQICQSTLADSKSGDEAAEMWHYMFTED